MLNDPQTRLIPDADLAAYRALLAEAEAAADAARTESGNARTTGEVAPFLEALEELGRLLNGLSGDAHHRYLKYGWPPDQLASDSARDIAYFLKATLMTYEPLRAAGQESTGMHALQMALGTVASTIRAARYAIDGKE